MFAVSWIQLCTMHSSKLSVEKKVQYSQYFNESFRMNHSLMPVLHGLCWHSASGFSSKAMDPPDTMALNGSDTELAGEMPDTEFDASWLPVMVLGWFQRSLHGTCGKRIAMFGSTWLLTALVLCRWRLTLHQTFLRERSPRRSKPLGLP